MGHHAILPNIKDSVMEGSRFWQIAMGSMIFMYEARLSEMYTISTDGFGKRECL